MRVFFKAILFIVLSTIVLITNAQNSRAVKLSFVSEEGFEQRNTGSNTVQSHDVSPYDIAKKNKTYDLFPGKRTKIYSYTRLVDRPLFAGVKEEAQLQLSFYATAQSNGDITTEIFTSCDKDINSDAADQLSSASKKYTTKPDKDSDGDYICFAYPYHPGIPYYASVRFVQASWTMENVKGKPLADFCPSEIGAGVEIDKTDAYGASTRKYFKTKGTLIKKSSTTCTYSGTIVEDISTLHGSSSYTSSQVSIAIDKAVSFYN